METIFIYLLKSSVLIAIFFLAYHFLLRNETFFNTNRWYLLSGLVTSVVLPLFFIKKIIYVEKPVFDLNEITQIPQDVAIADQMVSQSFEVNWFQIGFIVYGIVTILLFAKVFYNSISLYKILHKKTIIKEENHLIVDIQENIAPFSFFNFIVFNSDLYSEQEIQSILTHEKIHSKQKHSFDVLVSKLFAIVFWFNPFIHWYKKAIVQNLEYIADQKAIEVVQDKKSYQMTLLKVVSHQNCLSITNHFYQSLIKKRIVMLNKNQSQKRNSWKYALVIPVLIAFVMLFQVQTIAQEKRIVTSTRSTQSGIYITTDKNSSDEQLKKDAKLAKEKFGVTLKYSKIKRNKKGEITGIKVTYKDKEGNTGTTQFNGNEPIKPIYFYKTVDKIGFGKSNEIKIYSNSDNEDNFVFDFDNPMDEIDINIEVPEIAELPEPAESPEALETPEQLERLAPLQSKSRVYIKKNNDKPIVIIDGKVIEGADKLSEEQIKSIENGFTFNFDDEKMRIITDIDVNKIYAEAMNDAKIQLKRLSPEIKRQIDENIKDARRQIEEAREQMERNRPEMEERMRQMVDKSRPELEKARAEMEQARTEMLKAKADMEKAKAELEKAKAEMKK
ncbi:MAG: peptidase M56 [Flavobacterium sp.]|nr:peptidase M56 [Flavobacterium sp.]